MPDELAAAASLDVPVEKLRELAHAQQLEIAAQHRELLRLRTVAESAESERLLLARRVASLTSERDQYLQGFTEATQRVQVLREAAERADALHNQQRKEDTATFQANLRRLLSEKATLLEEIELVAGQKDALTEALVKANHSLETSRIATEEAEAYKQQHREAAERLQAGLAERDAAKLTAQHHKQQTANLQQQLSAAQQAIASQAVGVDALRTQLEASQQLGDEAKRGRSVARCARAGSRRACSACALRSAVSSRRATPPSAPPRARVRASGATWAYAWPRWRTRRPPRRRPSSSRGRPPPRARAPRRSAPPPPPSASRARAPPARRSKAARLRSRR